MISVMISVVVYRSYHAVLLFTGVLYYSPIVCCWTCAALTVSQ